MPKEIAKVNDYEYVLKSGKPVFAVCKVLELNESGYYKWKKRKGKKLFDESVLLAQIKEIKTRYPENENYGVKRIHQAMINDYGYVKGIRSIYRILERNGLLQKKKRNPNSLTKADKAALKGADLLNRNFKAEAPDEKWLTDITEIPCKDGKLYLCPVMDCFNGEILGIATAEHMRRELCMEAFKSACGNRNVRDVIMHSDRGSQFTSADYRELLKAYGAKQSMGGAGACFDNARMESFFATLKKEKLYKIRTEGLTKEQVKSIVFRYVMVYYNRQRLNGVNPGGWPPTVYREKFTTGEIAA